MIKSKDTEDEINPDGEDIEEKKLLSSGGSNRIIETMPEKFIQSSVGTTFQF